MFVFYTALRSLGDTWPRVSFSETLFFLWAGEEYWIGLFQTNQFEYSSSAHWKINHRSWNLPGLFFQNPNLIITLSVLTRNEGTGTSNGPTLIEKWSIFPQSFLSLHNFRTHLRVGRYFSTHANEFSRNIAAFQKFTLNTLHMSLRPAVLNHLWVQC